MKNKKYKRLPIFCYCSCKEERDMRKCTHIYAHLYDRYRKDKPRH